MIKRYNLGAASNVEKLPLTGKEKTNYTSPLLECIEYIFLLYYALCAY